MRSKVKLKEKVHSITFPYAPSPSNSPLVHRTDPVRVGFGAGKRSFGRVSLLLQEATSLGEAAAEGFCGARHRPSHPGLPQPTQPVINIEDFKSTSLVNSSSE